MTIFSFYFWRSLIAVSLIFATAFFVFAYLHGEKHSWLKAAGLALFAAFLATIFVILSFGTF